MSEENLDPVPVEDAPSPAETEARRFGWKPQGEFEGPEGKWRSAEEFLEEGKRINGFLRKDLDKIRNALSQKDSELAEMRQTMQQFAQYHQETEQRAYQRAVDELKSARKEALREGDGERVVALEDQLDRLSEIKPVAVPAPRPVPPQNQVDPMWVQWVGENPWFVEKEDLRAIADGYGNIVRRENPRLVGIAFLEEVKRRVQAEFPERFSSAPRRAATVGSSGESRAAKGRHTFSDLPPEAREACDRFVKQKLVVSREAYVKEFFGDAS